MKRTIESVLAGEAAYREKNREQILSNQKARRQTPEGKAKLREYNQAYREAHRKEMRARQKAYRQSPEGKAKTKEYNQSEAAKAARKRYQKTAKWRKAHCDSNKRRYRRNHPIVTDLQKALYYGKLIRADAKVNGEGLI